MPSIQSESTIFIEGQQQICYMERISSVETGASQDNSNHGQRFHLPNQKHSNCGTPEALVTVHLCDNKYLPDILMSNYQYSYSVASVGEVMKLSFQMIKKIVF